jgi:hypothetical protein
MNLFLGSETLREGEKEREREKKREREKRDPKRSPPFKVQSSLKVRAKFGPKRWARIRNSTPCLARVRREQKAASKGARFAVHFTQIMSFSEGT